MIHIEKISNTLVADENSHHHKWGHPQIYGGLIDNFYPTDEKTLYNFISSQNAKVLGRKLISKCKRNDIILGEEFGVKGVPLKDLLTLKDSHSHVWWETNFINLMQISKNHLRELLKTFKFIVHDYVEGGTFLTVGNIDPLHILKSIEPNCNVRIAHSGYDYERKDDVCIPMYAIHSYCHAKPYLPEQAIYQPTDLGLIFVNKPKDIRLMMLALLDKVELLRFFNWSCNINYHKQERMWFGQTISDDDVDKILNKNKYDQYEIYSGATLPANHNHYEDVENFKNRYAGVFPKCIDGLPFTKDSTILDSFKINPELIGKYRYNVVVETLQSDHKRDFIYSQGFVSDKTFKTMLYCAPILSVADIFQNRYLDDIGFQTTRTHGRHVHIADDLDNAPYDEQIHMIVDFLSNHVDREFFTVNKYIAEENYRRITDEDFLCNLVIQPLKKLATRQ